MASRRTVITYAMRTPIGKFLGGISSLPAPKLGAALVANALEQLALPGADVNEIIMGNVLTAGIGQAPARQAGIFGGLPDSVNATTIGKVCGSGMKAVMLADQAIRAGDANIIFAGGQENMSMAPHLLPNSRTGTKFGEGKLLDSMQFDGLWDPYNDMAMGNCGEICANKYSFSREAQDDYALESYKRARKALEGGVFAKEVLTVEVSSRKGSVAIELDEEPFSVDLDKVPTLKPAFGKEGTITAANASSLNDGAALLVAMDEDEAKARGLEPLAIITGSASVAGKPEWFTTAPVQAITKLMDKTGERLSEIDLFEINEAFSVVPMAAIQELKLAHEKVNVMGGAISLGHPIGCSGARILVTLINGLRSHGLRKGVAAICIGGGEACATSIELP